MKKFVCLFFALLISFSSLCVFGFDFPDMPDKNYWSYNALNVAVENNLLSGSNGMLLPKDNLTRAQMATILVRAYKKTEKADLSSFTDVAPEAWYYDSMAIAVNEGWFKGSGDGSLNPNKFITRQEVFVVLSRVFNMTEESEEALSKFADYADVASWAKQGTGAMLVNGVVGGSGNMLLPKDSITREQFAQIIYNAINKKFLVLSKDNNENNKQEEPKKPTIIVNIPEDHQGGLQVIDKDENDENFGEIDLSK